MTVDLPRQEVIDAILSDSTQVVAQVDIYEADRVTPFYLDAPVRDGSVACDATKKERRSIDLELDNSSGAFTHNPVDGLWYDKIIKPFRGISYLHKMKPFDEVLDEEPLLYLGLGDPSPGLVDEGILGVGAIAHGSVVGNRPGAWPGTNKRSSEFTVARPEGGITLGSLEALDDLLGRSVSIEFWWRSDQGTEWSPFSSSDNSLSVVFNRDDTPGLFTVTLSERGSPVEVFVPGKQNSIWHHFVVTVGYHVGIYIDGARVAWVTHEPDFPRPSGSLPVRVLGVDAVDTRMQGFALYSKMVTQEGVQNRFRAGRGDPRTVPKRWMVQLGEFMIDEIRSKNFPLTTKVTGRDLMKKLEGSKFTKSTAFAAGTAIEEIVRAVAVNGGILTYVLPLTNQTTRREFFFERLTSRAEALEEIATAYGYDIYFDATGTLQMTPVSDPYVDPIAFTFSTDPRTGTLIELDKSAKDTRIFNVVVAVGEGNDSNVDPVSAEVRNTLPGSPTNVDRLGERMYEIKSALIVTEVQARRLAESYLKIAALEEYNVDLGALTLPWLREGTIVEILDPSAGEYTPNRYLLSSLTIPLRVGSMSCNARRVTTVGEL